ncbi:MAG: hypothetical protein DU430_09175 [Candidatus Tokpelaia sp.]|nr:MAG: hypothetical protein DU430_09175 [Candidatus Tokpelaia sp.]
MIYEVQAWVEGGSEEGEKKQFATWADAIKWGVDFTNENSYGMNFVVSRITDDKGGRERIAACTDFETNIGI